MKKTTVTAGLIIVVASLAFLLYQKSRSANGDFVVGVLAEKTGVMGSHGQSIEMGVYTAADVINKAGGILARKVRVVSLDTQSDPAITAERAKELVQRNKVNLIIGTGLSSSTLAAIPITTEARIPFIYSMDGECKTCKAGAADTVSETVWGAGFTERMAVKPFLEFLGKQILRTGFKSKVYFAGGDYVYPRTTNKYARSTAEELGFQVVGEEYTDISTTDYSPLIRRILSSQADMLIITNPGDAASAFMRQAKQLGLSDKLLITGFATFAQEAIAPMGDVAEGVYYSNRYSDQLDNPENKVFLDAFKARYGQRDFLPGPSVAAGGYGPLMVAAKAYEKAKSVDSSAFNKAMRGLDVDLPQGKITVDPQNNIFRQHMYLLQIQGGKYKVLADLGQKSHPGFEGCSVK